MESLGQYLRGQRGTRGVSLEEVATRTRIGLHTLEALERDEYAVLPAEVTVKGFLRSYARALGLDERDVLARYQQHAAEHFQIAQETDPVKRVLPPDRHRLWQQHLTIGGLAAAGVMVVVSLVALWSPRRTPGHPTAISSPLELPPPIMGGPTRQQMVPFAPILPDPETPGTAGTPPVVPTDPTPASAPVPREASASQRLVITASEPSWVQAIIDDTETKEALMQPGERLEWSAQKHVRLTVGNAGGVSVQFNGEAVPSLGVSGRVRTVVFPREAVTAAAPAPRPASVPAPADSPTPRRESPALTSPADSNTVPIQPL